MFDPNADPLSDPELAELAMGKLMKAADHPWELEQPPDFDPIAATERFLNLIADLGVHGIDGEVQLWPGIRSATFHGELVLPRHALRDQEHAVLRASNFGSLIAVLRDENALQPEALATVRAAATAAGYRLLPASLHRKTYAGHHRGTRQFATWSDRLFDYL